MIFVHSNHTQMGKKAILLGKPFMTSMSLSNFPFFCDSAHKYSTDFHNYLIKLRAF